MLCMPNKLEKIRYYRSQLVDHTLYRDYGKEENMVYSSIRPGKRAGDPKVTDLVMLRYDPNGKMFYKLDFDEELRELPCRAKPVLGPTDSFPKLFSDTPKIPKHKFSDLQWLKSLMPSDTDPSRAAGEQEKKQTRRRKCGKRKKTLAVKKKKLNKTE